MPLTVAGLVTQTDYTFTVVAHYEDGSTVSATTGELGFYDVVETFYEPMTQPNNTIFTGAFTATTLRRCRVKPCRFAHGGDDRVPDGHGIARTPAFIGCDEPGWHQWAARHDIRAGDDRYVHWRWLCTRGNSVLRASKGTPNNHNAYAMIFVNTQDRNDRARAGSNRQASLRGLHHQGNDDVELHDGNDGCRLRQYWHHGWLPHFRSHHQALAVSALFCSL